MGEETGRGAGKKPVQWVMSQEDEMCTEELLTVTKTVNTIVERVKQSMVE